MWLGLASNERGSEITLLTPTDRLSPRLDLIDVCSPIESVPSTTGFPDYNATEGTNWSTLALVLSRT